MPAEESAKLRVLVVDDNMDCANSLSSLLQMMGCETVTVYQPEVAVHKAAEVHPELVILDLDLGTPGFDGCEVLRRVRQSESHGPYAVCLTGQSDEAARRRCVEAGFNRFLNKPLRLPELDDVLASCRTPSPELH